VQENSKEYIFKRKRVLHQAHSSTFVSLNSIILQWFYHTKTN